MANREQVGRLRKNVEDWNQWRREHPKAFLDLNRADLEGADLYLANLSDAGLGSANLRSANLTGANLKGAELTGANLEGANLDDAIPYRAVLEGANLNHALLTGANLTKASLKGANLKGVNLTRASLLMAQALGTDFTGATLTGACIEDWNINADTRLNDVVCEYVYLKGDQQERRPSEPNQSFAPGEFTKLFQKAQETVDLIFRHGVDWQALLISLEKLKVEAEGAELSIQAIENKNDGAFVVRVNVPPEANKGEVEKFLRREYDLALKALDERYQFQLQLQGERLEDYREQVAAQRQANTSLTRIIEKMAENQAPKFNFNAPVGSVADTIQSGGKQQAIQHNYAAAPSQTLAEAAAEIQALLQQLAQTNPTAIEADQKAFVNAALPSTTRDRLLGAAQGAGLAWLEGTPYGKITKALIEGWQQPNQ